MLRSAKVGEAHDADEADRQARVHLLKASATRTSNR
jgi:hypothetical protein